MKRRLIVYTDGAARGNPGPAAIGAVLYEEHEGSLHAIAAISERIGSATNNVAEYEAVLAALREAKSSGADEVVLRSDSQLLVKQLVGEYKVKAPHLVPLHSEALGLLRSFDRHRVEHVFREDNADADALANAALDG